MHDWAPVERLTVDPPAAAGRHSRVVVKYRRTDGPGHGGPAYLRREMVGLALAQDAEVCPLLHGAGLRGPAHFDEVVGACATLGLPSAERAIRDVADLAAALGDPGPCGALVHADLNPTNVLIDGDRAVLVDFEGCRYGPAGADACFVHFPFPHHSHPWATLPCDVVDQPDRAYRDALSPACADPAVVDGMIAVGAAINLVGRLRRLPLVASREQAPRDRRRRRGQLVAQCHVLAVLAAKANLLGVFATWCEDLAAAMTKRWPEDAAPAPAWHAFSDRP